MNVSYQAGSHAFTLKKCLSLMSRDTKAGCIAVILLTVAGSQLTARWPALLGEFCEGNGHLAAFGIVCLSAALFTISRRVLLDCVIAKHEAEVREASLERLLKMPEAYFQNCPSGEKTAQLNQGVAGLSQLIKIMCGDASAVLLTAAFTMIEVYRNASGLMAGIMLLYLAVTIFVSRLQIRSQKGIREAIILQKNVLDGKICQAIKNLKLIRSMNAETYERKRLSPDVRKISAMERNHHCWMGAFDCVKQGTTYLFLVLILYMYLDGNLPAKSAATVCFLFLQLVKPIDEVYRFLDEGSASLIKVKALLNIAFQDVDPIFSIRSTGAAPQAEPEIRFDGVAVNGLKYPDFSIPCGGETALCGESGCGKSTVALALLRYFPHRGKITLFGRDLGDISQEELTQLAHYVPLEDRFFSGTVRENLVYGIDRQVSDREAMEAMEKACLLDALGDALLGKELGEGGKGISSGQQQRLALARAFLRTPKLFILDESTANLDEAVKERVLDNLEAHARACGAGILHISHDKAVVERCGVAISLDQMVGKAAA